MRPVLYEQLAAVEDRLWWYQSRHHLVRSLLSRLSFPASAVALDIGCGTGGLLPLLAEFASRVIGMDKSEFAISLAKQKHPDADVRVGDANALGSTLPAEACDLVTLFNVLYHSWIINDRKTLADVWRLLKPGGFVVVTDSAFRCLTRHHDRAVMGARRYRLTDMRAMIEQLGFEWVTGTYFNLSSFPLAWLLARWNHLGGSDNQGAPLRELTVPPRWINKGMKLLMDVERGLTRVFGRLPLGVSLLCAGRKPTSAGRLARTNRDRPTPRSRLPESSCDKGEETEALARSAS